METEFVVEDIGFRKFKDTPYIRRYDWWNSTEQIIKHRYYVAVTPENQT